MSGMFYSQCLPEVRIHVLCGTGCVQDAERLQVPRLHDCLHRLRRLSDPSAVCQQESDDVGPGGTPGTGTPPAVPSPAL